MNELINNKNIFRLIASKVKDNLSIFAIFSSIVLVIFLFYQIYIFYKNNNLLKSSILYNIAKSQENVSDFELSIKKLSSNKNFYGILATLESIKLNLNSNNIEEAYKDYLLILNKGTLNSLYTSAITAHASYALLDKLKKSKKDYDSNLDILKKIENIIDKIDIKYDSYSGIKLEIIYLLSTAYLDLSIKNPDYNRNEIYQQIIANNKISQNIKDRVKKIHDFQKFK